MAELTDADVLAAPAAERGPLKAAAIAKLAGFAGRTIVRGRYTLTISAPSVVDGRIVFPIRLERAGVDVTPPEWEHMIRITNPPMCVEDPAGEIVREIVDPVTGLTTTRTLRWDPVAANLAVLRDTLTTLLANARSQP